MIGNQFLRTKSNSHQMVLAVGVAALAGIALIYAIPQTRKACGRWVNGIMARAKGRIKQANGNNWKRDLANAEKLKGPVDKRKKTIQINGPAVASSAWKDEWSSE